MAPESDKTNVFSRTHHLVLARVLKASVSVHSVTVSELLQIQLRSYSHKLLVSANMDLLPLSCESLALSLVGDRNALLTAVNHEVPPPPFFPIDEK
ncbi:hypothetical protein ACJIZ3_009630 [Penstemon smallii]|uniref:Uncharacterized protein n=1 Tax=Penstemon smallii TaxID=265156 RepID=A0ABD3TD23_9LAMI